MRRDLLPVASLLQKVYGEISMEKVPASVKMLVIDIDGTLLTPEGEITPRTRDAVRAAQQAGIVVTLATARRYCNTAKVATQLGLDIPLILYDGALIIKHPDGTLIHTHTLKAEVAQQAVNLLVRHHVQPVVHPSKGTAEEIWTGSVDFDNLWLEAYFTTFPEQVRRMPYEMLCTGHPDPLRVCVFTEEEHILGLIPEVSALPCSWTTIKRGSYGCAELTIMDPECSKASGVTALAHDLHIPLEQVMAIGDNNNDIQMLRTVGWGVAMEHASETVKAAAKAVTASNREDGVAQAIERYALCSPMSAASNSLNRSICL
jgi:Cof subfamily protein (haloacid dehalogenase superfamily)